MLNPPDLSGEPIPAPDITVCHQAHRKVFHVQETGCFMYRIHVVHVQETRCDMYRKHVATCGIARCNAADCSLTSATLDLMASKLFRLALKACKGGRATAIVTRKSITFALLTYRQ